MKIQKNISPGPTDSSPEPGLEPKTKPEPELEP